MIVYTCPKCGHDLIIEALTCIPPINKYYCCNCGWSHSDRKENREEIRRIPFGRNGFLMRDATKEKMKSTNEYVDSISVPNGINFYDNFYKSSSCDNCSNNPKNGGSGICNCILGQPRIY